MKCLKKKIPDNPGKFVSLLGTLEALTYTVVWVKDFPTFILVWLGIKMAGRWKAKEEEQKKGEINSFLIGNLLTVIFGIIAGATIKYLLQDGWNFKITF